MTTQATRNGQPWTEDDIRELRHLASLGMGASGIADALDRTITGVKSKALSLRIALVPRHMQPGDVSSRSAPGKA